MFSFGTCIATISWYQSKKEEKMKTLILIFVFFVSTCLYSTIINVPGDQPTIQQGIEAATNTDTVLVADGTYFENIDFIEKAITVASNFLINGDESHIANTIINGSQPINPDYGSVVTFASNEDTTSVITGFTLTEGTGTLYSSGYWGGGILCDSSSPKVISNIVTNNSADYTGGIVIVYDCSPVLLNNVISYNTATIDVGGVTLWDNCNAYLEGNIISNNTANSGCGGLLISESSPTLVSNVIRENSAVSSSAGGVYIQLDSSPLLLNNIICNNTSETESAGLGVYAGSGTSTTTVENCLIYGNTSGFNGGGLWVYNANIDVINCTISDNHADSNGGGVFVNVNGNVNLINGILWNNSPQEICIYSGSVTATYSDIQGGWAGDGNIDEDPLFAGTGEDPYSLLEDSPCIDAGIPDTTGLNLPEFDLAGNPRVFGGRIDMGAYEYYIFIADFEAAPTSGPAPLDVQFTDLSIGNPSSWQWDFDNDGTIDSYEQNPQWIYEEAGTYSVSLSIDDGINQSTEVKTDYITVNQVSSQEEIVALKTELYGNYPNPFNPSTTINFSIEQNQQVELAIYNLKGQKVKQLVCDQVLAGQHSVIWNGKNNNGKSVSSGIYFYKLKTDNFEKTKKMILMK